MSTILLWRLGALGDTLLLLPALAALRAARPTHEIVAAGNTTALAPALWSGLADRVIDAAAPALAALARGDAPAPGAIPPDVETAVVWSVRHAAIAQGLARAGIRRVIGAPALPPDRTPMAAHYLATLAPLGARAVPFTLSAPAEAWERTQAAWRRAASHGAPVALLHPGAGSPLKQWPLARYLELARALRADGSAVAWTAGPADEGVRRALHDAGEAANLLPELDVAALAAVLARAAVVVSGDCGVAHLAALLGVRGVALFGPTDQVVWGPPSRRVRVLRLALPCSPCGEIARHCPSHICLRGLPVAAVLAATQAQMAAAVSGRLEQDTAPPTGVSSPAESHPPAPAPAPPGALPVARWDGGRTWGAQASPAQR